MDLFSVRSWGVRGWATFLGLLVLVAVPTYASANDAIFIQDLFNRLMILAIAAVSLNLILGYGGMISFGHAAYLGIGAYCVGIPAYYDIEPGWQHFGLAIVASAAYALVTGAICLRTKGVYFIMITMAYSQMVFFAFVSIEEYGGDDGLVIYFRSIFPNPIDLEDAATFYYVTWAFLVASLFVVHRIVRSRFGMVIEGSKDNERRMQSIGYDTYTYRLVCYVISGIICGIAGALLGNFTTFISPDMLNWVRSGELIFMVVLGGAGTIFGPVMGAAAFVLIEEALSGFTIYWQFWFGLMLIGVVLFARGGIDGLMRSAASLLGGRSGGGR